MTRHTKAIIRCVLQPQITQVLHALKAQQIACARPHIGNERNAAGESVKAQHLANLNGIRRSPVLGNMQ